MTPDLAAQLERGCTLGREALAAAGVSVRRRTYMTNERAGIALAAACWTVAAAGVYALFHLNSKEH